MGVLLQDVGQTKQREKIIGDNNIRGKKKAQPFRKKKKKAQQIGKQIRAFLVDKKTVCFGEIGVKTNGQSNFSYKKVFNLDLKWMTLVPELNKFSQAVELQMFGSKNCRCFLNVKTSEN